MVLKGGLNGKGSALNLDVLKKTLYANVGMCFCIEMGGPSTLCFQCTYCICDILIRMICNLPLLWAVAAQFFLNTVLKMSRSISTGSIPLRAALILVGLFLLRIHYDWKLSQVSDCNFTRPVVSRHTYAPVLKCYGSEWSKIRNPILKRFPIKL